MKTHTMLRTLTILPFALWLGACLPTARGGGGGGGDDENNPPVSTCGNGVVEAGEACDGDCPTTCDGLTACVTSTLVGSADACSAECEIAVVTACVDGDGCCAAGCTSANDDDCSDTCGDNVVDPGETCDGDCPESCVAPDACTNALQTGSADTCSIDCVFEPIADCDVSDTCGDGVVVAGETCDGNCPTSCDDGDACTQDGLSGRAELCNAICFHDPVTSCTDGDGCCAPGCTSSNDDDCVCVPRTCAEVGASCGSAPDGCGGTLSCGGCPAGEACETNQCILDVSAEIGEACADDTDCAGNDPICADNQDFDGGFCTASCTDDFGCPQGTHCAQLPFYSDKVCAPNCQADNDCRPGGSYGCWDADEDGKQECFPKPLGSSPAGGACSGLSDCDANAQGCLIQPTQFPGGLCARQCLFGFDCPGTMKCVTIFGEGRLGVCLDDCTDDPNACRQNYTCSVSTDSITGEQGGICFNQP